MTNKTERRIARLKEEGVRFVKKMPRGWKVLHGATTAPNGYTWVWNGRNPFTPRYRHALLRVA